MTDTDARVLNAGSTRGRPFGPGNPGRRPGSRNRRTTLAERLMQEDLEDVVRAVITAARGGDMVAARIIMDRLVPVRRGRPVQFDMPGGMDASGLAAAFDALVRAVAGGELSPEEGQAVAGILEARRKAVETLEIEARLKALEKGAKP
jgi:hypothetical protein